MRATITASRTRPSTVQRIPEPSSEASASSAAASVGAPGTAAAASGAQAAGSSEVAAPGRSGVASPVAPAGVVPVPAPVASPVLPVRPPDGSAAGSVFKRLPAVFQLFVAFLQKFDGRTATSFETDSVDVGFQSVQAVSRRPEASNLEVCCVWHRRHSGEVGFSRGTRCADFARYG